MNFCKPFLLLHLPPRVYKFSKQLLLKSIYSVKPIFGMIFHNRGYNSAVQLLKVKQKYVKEQFFMIFTTFVHKFTMNPL